jgi:phosphatidylglycerophosphatase A
MSPDAGRGESAGIASRDEPAANSPQPQAPACKCGCPVRLLLLTGLGTGYLPIAPGTWGSAGACAVFLAVAFAAGGRQICVTGTMLILAAAATLICGLLGRWAEADFGRKDPGQVTLDEWAGQAVALCWLPLGAGPWGWIIPAMWGFVAFRFFDIIKPPPIRQLEKLPGGWGIVADDLLAGVYANLVIQLILRSLLIPI